MLTLRGGAHAAAAARLRRGGGEEAADSAVLASGCAAPHRHRLCTRAHVACARQRADQADCTWYALLVAQSVLRHALSRWRRAVASALRQRSRASSVLQRVVHSRLCKQLMAHKHTDQVRTSARLLLLLASSHQRYWHVLLRCTVRCVCSRGRGAALAAAARARTPRSRRVRSKAGSAGACCAAARPPAGPCLRHPGRTREC